jgi:hypothetical protein
MATSNHYIGLKRERELHHHYRWMVQHGRQLGVAQGGAIRKRKATTFIEGRYWVWCNKEGNELTYRQVSRVTNTSDEVKTCPTHYTPPPLERKKLHKD